MRYFMAVAQLGSFSRAAAQCHVSQPALSVQIQRLEIQVGKTLLSRNHRRIVPTEAGQILIQDGKEILEKMDNTERKIRCSGEPHTGDVTFGILPTIAPFLLPHLLGSFVARSTGTKVAVHESLTGQSLELIEAGKLDFAIVCLPIRDQGFDTENLLTEEMLFASHLRHPLARKREIFAQDLRSEEFILMQEEHCLSEQVVGFCHRQDFHPRITMRLCQLATVQSLVASDAGISLIPHMAILEKSEAINYRQLENPRPKRTIAVVTRRKRPLKIAVQEFLHHLRHVGKTFKLPAINQLHPPSPEKPKA